MTMWYLWKVDSEVGAALTSSDKLAQRRAVVTDAMGIVDAIVKQDATTPQNVTSALTCN